MPPKSPLSFGSPAVGARQAVFSASRPVLLPSEKTNYFDWYWETRDLDTADLRSIERARIVLGLLGRPYGKLLDAGCGRGLAAALFQQAGFTVTGWDISPEAVAVARAFNVSAQVVDIEEDRLSGKFDVIVLSEVLQQVADPLRVVLRLKKVAHSGCRWVISLPNEFHLWRRLAIFFGRNDLAGHAAPHLRLFDFPAMERFFAAAGLAVTKSCVTAVAPPGWHFIQPPAQGLAETFPGLFALSGIFLLEER